jgi:DNA primase
VAQFSEVLDGVDYDWGETRRILAQLQQLRHDSEIADLAARAPNDPAVLERLRELLAQSRTRGTPSKPA